MRVEWPPAAERDREGQIAYIGERDPWAAIAMGDAIETAVRRLADHPRMGRLGRVAGTRELVVSGTPFVIADRVEPGAVLLVRLPHGAQRCRPVRRSGRRAGRHPPPLHLPRPPAL